LTRIIALTGYAGSGKSTVARHLVEAHGFTLVKFAGPLKGMMRALGLGDREIEGDLKEQPHPLLCGKTPRHAMQTLGTEWGRTCIGPDFWVNAAMENVHAVLDQGGSVVIDDCRFYNEGEAVRALGGEVIHIRRPCVGPVSAHPSESLGARPSHLFLNDGTEDDLRTMVSSYIISRSLT
jgi:hypothetical protein